MVELYSSAHSFPLNARLTSYIRSTALQNEQTTEWKGWLIAKACLAGHAAGMALALVEGVAAFCLERLTSSLNEYIQSKKLHTFSTQAHGYATHSILNLAITFSHLRETVTLDTNLLNAVADRLPYLLSCVIARHYEAKNAKLHNRDTREIFTIFAFQQILLLIKEMVDGAGLDRQMGRETVIGGHTLQHDQNLEIDEQTISSFFETYPQHLNAFKNLEFSHLVDREKMIEQAKGFYDLLSFIQLIETEEQPNVIDVQAPGEYVTNSLLPHEIAYQNALINLVSQSIKELYQNPDYIMCFGNSEEQGKEALKESYPEVFAPLAYYVQLKELEGDLQCPASFSKELEGYNKRLSLLQEAKSQLNTLNEDEKTYLTYKLLLKKEYFESSIFEESRRLDIHTLFLKISQLAGSLLQGTLMSQSIVRINEEGELEFLGANLFQNGYQEAIKSLT
ncbi:MAG: hypothetical protein LW832_10075 [Parachlamydia sp.]|nr:hypothetical protein [Parachlamydia sp.]